MQQTISQLFVATKIRCWGREAKENFHVTVRSALRFSQYILVANCKKLKKQTINYFLIENILLFESRDKRRKN